MTEAKALRWVQFKPDGSPHDPEEVSLRGLVYAKCRTKLNKRRGNCEHYLNRALKMARIDLSRRQSVRIRMSKVENLENSGRVARTVPPELACEVRRLLTEANGSGWALRALMNGATVEEVIAQAREQQDNLFQHKPGAFEKILKAIAAARESLADFA